MKASINLLVFLLLSSSILFAQEKNEKEEKVVTNGDTTRINLKKTTIIFIDKSNDSLSTDSSSVDKDDKPSYYQHWSGLMVVVNMLVNDQMSIARPSQAGYMELNHARSLQWQFNFAEKSIPIYKNYLQLTSGIGLDVKRFVFRSDFSLAPGTDSVIALSGPYTLEKNNLNIAGVRVPPILGINTSNDPEKGMHITAGVIGAYNMSVNLRQKYFDNGEKHVVKIKNPFNVNRWNVSAVAGIGFGDWLYVFSEYQLTSFFESGLQPELAPFTVGIRILDFE